ncbi:PRC and DUF2382 domain-containing protein [Geodermatophilus sp. CPCC 205761]|uniref:PRC and DUF2382 domain-containing protein n=1 Tax=Geodermatophilus sp. CPCC 205761 TaxID=2936597 RepID=UPI003EEFAC0F
MLSERELSAAIGSAAYGPDGEKIGTVEHFFTDDLTGAPTWVAVSTGLFGTRHSVVPAGEATFSDGVVQLPVTKDAVKSAPSVSDEHLDPDAEQLLRRHYGLGGQTGTDGAGSGGADAGVASSEPGPASSEPGTGSSGPARAGVAPAGAAPAGAADATTATVPPGGRAGDTVSVDEAALATGAAPTAAAPATDGAMTRSEEQLRVGTERVATTRARLVKYVVTEEVTITVPIRREEIRVEEVPVDAPHTAGESLVDTPAAGGAAPVPGGDTAAPGGAGLPEEIVLHAERPVVSVEVVPVERVRLRTEVVQGQEQISDQVQREQIVVDQDRTR